MLSTAGNLVFEGTADGTFEAYRADNGRKSLVIHCQTGVMAGPVAYEVNGEQYIAVLLGLGRSVSPGDGRNCAEIWPPRNVEPHAGFKLGGKATLPAASRAERSLN